jgi:integral membrane protein (TIGR01906 family)
MKIVLRIVSIVILLALPTFIIMTCVRLLLTPLTLQVEYNVLKISPDPYGMTTQERLRWSKISLDYLLNSQGISFLAEKKLDDGNPLFNERELDHMQDVKQLIHGMLIAWVVTGAFLVASRFIYGACKSSAMFWSAISVGGWITTGLVVTILMGVLLNFDVLFTDFHLLFFTGDSWLFYTSDTLIRLFPMDFWSNLFVALGAFMLVFGLVFGFLGRGYRKKAIVLDQNL